MDCTSFDNYNAKNHVTANQLLDELCTKTKNFWLNYILDDIFHLVWLCNDILTTHALNACYCMVPRYPGLSMHIAGVYMQSCLMAAHWVVQYDHVSVGQHPVSHVTLVKSLSSVSTDYRAQATASTWDECFVAPSASHSALHWVI